MTRTIFRNILLVGILVLLLCGALFFALQYSGAKQDIYDALQQEAIYAEQGLMLQGVTYLERLDHANRITWIAASGEVIYDSEFSAQGPNQKEYPEVRDAVDSGSGQAIRTSVSSGESTMYYAVLCEDGTILRLSRPLRSVTDALLRVSPVLWVLVIVLLISAVLAFRAARKIVRPINEIDLDHPDLDAYPELRPLLEKIQEQKLTIQEESVQREQMRREFTANVSHELKTPLTSISGFAELMSQGLAAPDKMQEFSKDIYKESRRLISLIDDIIALSKLDEEAVEPEREAVDLYDLSYQVVESLEYTAGQHGVTLELSGRHGIVSGVYRILHEMVFNLCDNAIKYNHSGGRVNVMVEMVDGADAGPLYASGQVAPEGGPHFVKLTVADTGVGIPEEYQERVFERFFRVDKSRSSSVGGTGLGLSIVKHGARFHNAPIFLESAPGAGTTISLLFPGE